ncbi:zinc finger protein 616 [Denticeps clupeoides]|uniref:C2H2-type domain-containing protein n=1 Tax=Denticeps clupeoides TaxID=299321 RepID=A0AAY4AF51_9TELE|nr:zinc finger protein 616-like [Denticeps clupeoides]
MSEDGCGGPAGSENRVEVVELGSVHTVTIKEERIEEDEYDQIKLGEAAASSQRAANSGASPDQDDRVGGDWQISTVDCVETFGDEEEPCLEDPSENTHDGPIVCLDVDSQWNDLLVSEDGGRRILCCALCGRKFSNSRGFFSHQLKHRNQARQQGLGPVKPRLYECEDCGKSYSSVGQYLNHQRSHKQASKSVFHQLAHLKKKSFQCPTCGRSYSRASALDAHRRCHEVKLVKSRNSGTLKSQLPVASIETDCDDKLSSKPAKESPEKTYACTCGRSFRTACGLSTHQRFSSVCSPSVVKVIKEEPKRPFQCSECGKEFISNIALACHERWHKRRDQSGISFTCEECGKVFTSLTFYHKHQRVAHSEEAPAKSFLHQVHQLKKNAFECEDCGRRFSRASALQSHRLCHTDVYDDVIENAPQTLNMGTSPQEKLYLCDNLKTENFAIGAMIYSQDNTQVPEIDEEQDHGTDYNLMSSEELNVEVVSVTESDFSSEHEEVEEDVLEDRNPDLHLVCESDHDEKEETSANQGQVAPDIPSEHLKPEVDVKIVQVEFEPADDNVPEEDSLCNNAPTQLEKYECLECVLSFDSAEILHRHRLWHMDGTGEEPRVKSPEVISTSDQALICEQNNFSVGYENEHVLKHEEPLPTDTVSEPLDLKKNVKCDDCGMLFSRFSALLSHQQQQHTVKKPFACQQCDQSYSNADSLHDHQKVCSAKPVQENVTVEEKRDLFNPKKTLLGPKAFHCELCGKSFWSSGALSHHKQSQCEDVKSDVYPALNGRGRPGKTSCPVCGLKLRRRSSLARHMIGHSQKRKAVHTCEVCGKSYHLLTCFLKHQLVHETPLPPAKSFDHQVEQVKKNTYSCVECGKLFSREMALRFHMKSHTNEVGYTVSTSTKSKAKGNVLQCPSCSTRFSNEGMLQAHQKQCGKPEKTAEMPSEPDRSTNSPKPSFKSKLQDSGKTFSVLGALNFHRRINSHLSKSKSKMSRIALHGKFCKREINKTGPYVCPECGRHFANNSALGTHRRWHTDKRFAGVLSVDGEAPPQRPFLCNLCGKGFFYLCVLRRHQRHHPPPAERPETSMVTKTKSGPSRSPPPPGETTPRPIMKPPSVPVAMRGSKTSPKLTVHQCPHCPKCFLKIRGLRAHKWQMHRKAAHSAKTLSPPKPLTCSGCEKPYNSQGALYSHQRSCGIKKEPPDSPPAGLEEAIFPEQTGKCFFKCHKCGKAFPSENHLAAHRDMTKSRPYCCALCCRGYWTEAQLQQHLAWHDEVRRRLPAELRYRLSASLSPGFSSKAEALPQSPPLSPGTQALQGHKCHYCGKSFLSPHALQQHEALHKTNETYHCTFCPQIFTEVRDIIQHQQQCKGEKEQTGVPTRDTEHLKCIECGMTFGQETELHQHYIEHARGVC